ncbi:MAG: HAMP domain-containing sensor histidine kinase [Candidatus Daviesbacteria bacterium]|nr:HAMP domain-containing sensor histidine kinase [Candidatus Daviesbacteria bacterium]
MFTKARFKLTGWYLLIIMIISILFSGVVYQQSTQEIGRGLRMQALRFNRERALEEQLSHSFDISVLEEAKKRIALQLLFINLGILVLSGLSAYFLAGKTLKPIEKTLDEQKRFISDASHELRTPLTALKSEIEVTLRDKNFNLKEAQKLLQSNLEEVDKMQSLSNYLLTLNKYQNSKIKLDLEMVKVSEVLEKAILNVQKLATKKNIRILQKGKDVETITNYQSLIELISILLDNAIKYSGQSKTILISTKYDHKNVYISVKDQGIGMRASDIPYIFNRFFRADISRSKTQVEGFGLGLSIAKGIVEPLHGKISVESSLNEGSTFLITLPIKFSFLSV